MLITFDGKKKVSYQALMPAVCLKNFLNVIKVTKDGNALCYNLGIFTRIFSGQNRQRKIVPSE